MNRWVSWLALSMLALAIGVQVLSTDRGDAGADGRGSTETEALALGAPATSGGRAPTSLPRESPPPRAERRASRRPASNAVEAAAGELAAPHRVTVRIVDHRGIDVGGALYCYAQDEAGSLSSLGRHDVAIEGTVIALPSDAEQVFGVSSAGDLARATIEGSSIVGSTLELRVPGTIGISGRCIDLDDRAGIESASFLVARIGLPSEVLAGIEHFGGWNERSVACDAAGSFVVAAVPPGRYELTLAAPGYESIVAERDLPSTDWAMGDISLERHGSLAIRLVGRPAEGPPMSVATSITSARVTVDSEGRAILAMPASATRQDFVVWLGDGSMLNVYKDGRVDDVGEVTVRVGGGNELAIDVTGLPSEHSRTLGEPAVQVRYVSELGYRADWNRGVAEAGRFTADVFDASRAAVSLVLRKEGWPNIVCAESLALRRDVENVVALRYPAESRRLRIATAQGGPLAEGTFVELRRPRDDTRWLASAHTDVDGSIPLPEVSEPRLLCAGCLQWEPVESFFLDLTVLAGAPGSGDEALVLGPSREHRVQVLDGDLPKQGCRLHLMGCEAEYAFSYFDSGEDGRTAPFLLTEGSRAKVAIDDETLWEHGRHIELTTSSPRVEVHGLGTLDVSGVALERVRHATLGDSVASWLLERRVTAVESADGIRIDGAPRGTYRWIDDGIAYTGTLATGGVLEIRARRN